MWAFGTNGTFRNVRHPIAIWEKANLREPLATLPVRAHPSAAGIEWNESLPLARGRHARSTPSNSFRRWAKERDERSQHALLPRLQTGAEQPEGARNGCLYTATLTNDKLRKLIVGGKRWSAE